MTLTSTPRSVGPMDFDREIQTVGLGNLLSGCTGGFTGSYIFSDTKMALNNVGAAPVARLCGLVVAASLLGVYALPFSLMTVLPSAFFGGMLIYISFAFLDETLIHTWHSCARMEYGVIIVTLVAINVFGVPVGMVTGAMAQVAVFSLQYGSAGTVVTQRFWHSNVIRGIRERAITGAQHGRIITLELHGFLFFGSAVSLLRAVGDRFRDRAGKAAAEESDSMTGDDVDGLHSALLDRQRPLYDAATRGARTR